MNIRNATFHDAPVIKQLMEQLGYTTRVSIIVDQLVNKFDSGNHGVWVYELRKEVVGFVALHYLPQFGQDGEVMIVTQLAIDEVVRHIGIEMELEQFFASQARLKKCTAIQIHCMDLPTRVNEFYAQQGYQVYPNYLMKRL